MQHMDNQLAFAMAGGCHSAETLQSSRSGKRARPICRRECRRACFASHSNGEPGNVILEALANLSFTAHLLALHMVRRLRPRD